MSVNKCPKCHNMVSVTDKFCPDCGTPIEKITPSVSICNNCNHENQQGVAFCEKCGKPIRESSGNTQKSNSANDRNKIVSKGNYKGTMIKGKTSRGWKIFRNIIIVVVLIGTIALIIWIKTDPDAKEKLSNILFGLVVMAIFGAVIWRKSRKGSIKSSKERQANYDWDDDYDNDAIDDD